MSLLINKFICWLYGCDEYDAVIKESEYGKLSIPICRRCGDKKKIMQRFNNAHSETISMLGWTLRSDGIWEDKKCH